jgi:hypothetical protein
MPDVKTRGIKHPDVFYVLASAGHFFALYKQDTPTPTETNRPGLKGRKRFITENPPNPHTYSMNKPDRFPPFLFLGIPRHRLPRLTQAITQDRLVLSDFFSTGQNEPIRFRTSEIIARTDAVVQNPAGILEADARSGAVIRIDTSGLQSHDFEIDGNTITLAPLRSLSLPAGTWAFSNHTLDFLIEIIGKAGTPKEKQCARLLCEFDHSPGRRLDAVFEFLKIHDTNIDAAASKARSTPAFTVGKDTFSITPFKGATGGDVNSAGNLSLSSFSPPVPDERERGKRKEKDSRQS